MARPFKVTGIGPVSLFVDDLDRATRFYTDVLGFGVRERVQWGGHEGVLLYSDTDHHTLALYAAALRSALGCRPGGTRWRSACAWRTTASCGRLSIHAQPRGRGSRRAR